MSSEHRSASRRRTAPSRIALLLAVIALAIAACGGDAGTTTAPRDAVGLGSEGDTSSTGGEETTTIPPAEPCPLPQPLPRGAVLGEGLTRLHRAATAFAESAVALRDSLRAAVDFAPGWGAREPVASALYRLQADLYTLADLTERTFTEDGAAYSPESGWVFPEGYPLAPLAVPWEQIPVFQAVALTDLFAAEDPETAAALFDAGACSLVAAFSAAVDQAAAAHGA